MSLKNARNKSKNALTKGRTVGQACLSLFDRRFLPNDAALESAVCTLDGYLADPTADIDEAIRIIKTGKYLLEFIFCVASDDAFDRLSTTVLQPITSTSDFLTSTAAGLLSDFSVSLLAPYESVSDAPKELLAYRRSVDAAPPALQTILALISSGTLPDEDGEGPETRWAAKNKDRQQAKRKKRSAHAGREPAAVDEKPILDYGERVPTSKLQAVELAVKIIGEQMSILRGYLTAFRTNAVVDHFRTMFLPQMTALASINTRDSEHEGRSSIALTPSSQGTDPPEKKTFLYFENAEDFGNWRVQVSTRAGRDLRRANNEDAKRFYIIYDKIKELSHGHFTRDNHKKLTGVDVGIPIYEAKMTRDSRLVYQIHCALDHVRNVERQVIRVFGVYTHAQIDGRFWDSMSRQLTSRGSEYRKRCIFRNRPTNQRGNFVVEPQEFPRTEEDMEEETEGFQASPSSTANEILSQDAAELHSLLALEKFVTFSQGFLNGILADRDVAHVFDVSPREQEIIDHTSSCFVLGRSGTGKTTTMMFKILSIERSWDAFKESMAKPRQLFVTKSEVLAQKVEEYYMKLHQSLETANLSPAELKSIVEVQHSRRQAGLLVDADEEVHFSDALPTRYGALEDRHFPLFLTYDHLCRLLENEFSHIVQHDRVQHFKAVQLRDILRIRPPNAKRTAKPHDVGDDRDAFVDYDGFREKYWSHSLGNQFNPELVFGEFMGVIKGSEKALSCDEGFLDKESYCKISRRTQSTSSAQREAIYAVFEKYTKRKKESGQYDIADRTGALIKCLDIAGVPGIPLDFIYVDEAQDNLLIDALVLRKLCPNPHGMFWAGDTAQTISAGSTFRFDELRAFMHQQDKRDQSLTAKRARPKTFHLAVNYRSHAGIVDCAHSIVQLIAKHWPDAIDHLPPERGMNPGPKPTFFGNQDAVELQRALFSDETSGVTIEFGARQCILVRDEAAKIRLRNEVGKGGQILTVYQSKGLEFDDVLLYNFFEDSSVDYNQWRFLLNELTSKADPNMRPHFTEGRYNDICRELKHLYVAVTRARMKLWIADCSQRAEPFRLLLTHKGLVENHVPGKPILRLAKSSTKEEWAEAARSLFNKRQYSEAMYNFERAGLPHEQQVALAYHLRDQARSAPVAVAGNARGKVLSQASAFAQAAEAFIASVQGAAPPEKRAYYRIAGDCYARSGDHRQAGDAYHAAAEYTLAAQHYRKAGSFDEAVKVVKSHEAAVVPEVVQNIIDVSRLYYIKEDRLEDARGLFDDDDKALEYMDDYGLDDSRASLLERLERYDEAAECHLLEGNTLEAIRLFRRQSVSRAVGCVLDGLWSYLSLGAHEQNINHPMVVALLEHSYDMEKWADNEDVRNELVMFRAIYEQDIPLLNQLGETFHKGDNHPATLLCLDHVFSHDFDLRSASLSEIALCFQTFLIYVRLLQKYTCDPVPCINLSIQRLFAFKPTSEEVFSLPKHGYLARCHDTTSTVSGDGITDSVNLPRWKLEPIIKTVFRSRLHERVWSQKEMAHTLRRLRPCPLFATGSCPRRECAQYHISVDEDRVAIYNVFVRIHVLEIMIFHTLYATNISYSYLVQQQKAWLRRLYEALYPPHANLGSLHLLSPQSIPELMQGRRIVAVWLQDFLNDLNPDQSAHAFCANLMRATRLAMLFDRRTASYSLQRIPCAVRTYGKTRLRLMRHDGRKSMPVVPDLVAFMQRRHPAALDKGVVFLNHILVHNFSVDIGVLCDFMDELCGSMLVAMRHREMRSLHGLMLPRSWIVRLLSDVDKVGDMWTNRSADYTHSIASLLQKIYTGFNAEHLLFEKQDLSSNGLHKTRVLLFLRVCRNLCLWGYNIDSGRVRDEIRRIISSIGNADRTITNPLASAYIYARDWAGLVRALFRTTQIDVDAEMDEMVQLRHRSSKNMFQSGLSGQEPGNNPRRLVYHTTDEIIPLLRAENVVTFLSDPSTAFNSSNSTTTRHVPRTLIISEQHMQDNAGLLPSESGQDSDDDAADEAESDAPQTEFTSREAAAVNTIVVAYREYMQRKAVEKDMSVEMQRRIYATFRTQSETMCWSRSDTPYRLLFLGAVPQLVFAVENIIEHLHAAKSSARAAFRKADHQDLEGVQAMLDENTRLVKEALSLRVLLGPKGVVHQLRDLGRLRELSLAAKVLLAQVDVQVGGLHGHIEDALMGIRRVC